MPNYGPRMSTRQQEPLMNSNVSSTNPAALAKCNSLCGDSAYSRNDIMSWCEARGIDYVFGLAGERLGRMTLPLHEPKLSISTAKSAS